MSESGSKPSEKDNFYSRPLFVSVAIGVVCIYVIVPLLGLDVLSALVGLTVAALLYTYLAATGWLFGGSRG